MPAKKIPKSKVKKAKTSTKKPAVKLRAENGSRLRKLNRRQTKKVEKKSQKSVELPNAWVVLGRSVRHLYRNRKLFFGISLVYGVLYILLVKGVSANFQLGSLRQNLSNTFSGNLSGLSMGVALYGLLLGSAGGSSSEAAGTYQTVLVIIVSLALIWALRSTYAEHGKLRIRDSFYKGMYPLVPFVIISLLVVLQLLPALIVGSLYSVVQSNGLVTGGVQQAIALVVLAVGLLWTFYMLSSSIFAFYIVTLADTPPVAALKLAKKLVRFKRQQILRKVLFLPAALLLFSAFVLIPLIIIFPLAAEVLFMLFTVLLLSVVHSYFYSLYRSLL
ncbi:hypothetical protein BH10PAT3_BH10PAT3_3880 [soil metagenome]